MAKATGDVAELVGRLEPGVQLAQRLQAAQALAGFGEEAAAAVPSLVECLGTDHQAMRVAATYALGALGEPAIEPLLEALRRVGREAAEHEVPPGWHEGAINMEGAAQALERNRRRDSVSQARAARPDLWESSGRHPTPPLIMSSRPRGL